MKKFNDLCREALLITSVKPESDTAGAVTPSCPTCSKDMFSQSVDDFLGQNIPQPTDNIDQSGEIEGDSDNVAETDGVELECTGDGLKVKFNGLEIVLPKSVVEKIKEYESSDNENTENETEESGENNEAEESEESEESNESDENSDESSESEESEDDKKENSIFESKGKAVNPWAICNKSTGGKKKAGKEKFEKCVMDVKSKHKIKK